LRLAGLATGRVALTSWVAIVFQTALITVLVALCGVAIAGVESAFWGVIAGALALLVQRAGKSRFDLPPR